MMIGWLRKRARKIGSLRDAYRWVQRQMMGPGSSRALREATVVFLLQVVYYGLVSPYAIIRRYLLGRSLLRTKAGWQPMIRKPMTTGDKSIYRSIF